jgi:chromate transporter
MNLAIGGGAPRGIAPQPPARGAAAPAADVFRAALKLGCTSFGGPVAHIGYFERAYVNERRWLSHAEYSSLVGMCQLLPGPTSSQLGFLIGYHRAGWSGALAAWAGFTLPSALLMYGFALFATRLHGSMVQSVVHGLLLAAAAVVAQAVWSMGRNLCPDAQRVAIALLAAALLLLHPGANTQIAAMAAGALGGWLACRKVRLPAYSPPVDVGFHLAGVCLGVFFTLAVVLPALAMLFPHGLIAFGSLCYRAGALVFGGGHVVLPLLRDALVPAGWLSDDAFLGGYGFAQAIPGPLFTLAAYLGAASAPAHFSALWAGVGLLAIFLPGLLLAITGAALLRKLAAVPSAISIIAGVNAAVVGILGAALYTPVCVSAIRSALDGTIALIGFVLLMRYRTAPVLVVALCVLASTAIG